MGLFDGILGESEKPDWKKHDYEQCGRCGCTRTWHSTACTKCRKCDSFLPSGNIGSHN